MNEVITQNEDHVRVLASNNTDQRQKLHAVVDHLAD